MSGVRTRTLVSETTNVGRPSPLRQRVFHARRQAVLFFIIVLAVLLQIVDNFFHENESCLETSKCDSQCPLNSPPACRWTQAKIFINSSLNKWKMFINGVLFQIKPSGQINIHGVNMKNFGQDKKGREGAFQRGYFLEGGQAGRC